MTNDDRRSLFHSIAEAISSTMNLPVSIWVPHETITSLRIATSVGLPQSYTTTAKLVLTEPSVTGEAFQSGRPVATRDILNDPRWKYKEVAREMGWKSALSVPITAREETI